MKPELVISHERILKGITAQASRLNDIFEHKSVTLLPIEEGANFYCSVLRDHLEFDYAMDSIKVHSYVGTESKELGVSKYPHTDLYGRTVLILDDIYDTGRTMAFVKDLCHKRGALSVFSSVLLYKLNVPNRVKKDLVDFSCFNIQNEFVIGSGLDFNGEYREMEGVWKLPEGAY